MFAFIFLLPFFSSSLAHPWSGHWSLLTGLYGSTGPDSLEDPWDPKEWWSCLLFSVSWHWGRMVQKTDWAYTCPWLYWLKSKDGTILWTHEPLKTRMNNKYLTPKHPKSIHITSTHPLSTIICFVYYDSQKAFNLEMNSTFPLVASSSRLSLFAPVPTSNSFLISVWRVFWQRTLLELLNFINRISFFKGNILQINTGNSKSIKHTTLDAR